jgi:hypothetical protein
MSPSVSLKRAWWPAVAATVMATTGCPSQSAGRVPAKEQTECTARVTALRGWLAEVDADGTGGGVPPLHGKLVSVDERANAVVDGPAASLDGASVVLDGAAVGSSLDAPGLADHMRSRRRARRELWEQTHPGKSGARLDAEPLFVLLTEGDAWATIAVALDAAARAGYPGAQFLFEGRAKAAPPLPTPVSSALQNLATGEAADPSQKARLLAGPAAEMPAARAFAGCPEIASSLGQLAERAMSAEEKRAEIGRRVPDAIEQCGCKVDMNEVEAVIWSQYGRYDGTPKVGHLVVVVPHDAAAGSTEIAAAATATWASVASRVVDASRAGQKVSFATVASR